MRLQPGAPPPCCYAGSKVTFVSSSSSSFSVVVATLNLRHRSPLDCFFPIPPLFASFRFCLLRSLLSSLLSLFPVSPASVFPPCPHPSLQFVVVVSIINFKPLTYDDYVYPPWANWVGWGIALSSMILVPAYVIYKFFSIRGSLWEVSSGMAIVG